MSELRRQAMHGIWWNLFNTTSQSILQSVQFLVLAMYLLPADYGVVGLAYVLSGFLVVFQDMGFSAVVVQRSDIQPAQLSSLWWLNIASGLVILLILGGLSWPASAFYGMPELVPILWALGGNFLIASFGLQYAWLCEKHLRFGFLSKLDTVAGIISSGMAILLAMRGFGAWSIVIANTIQSLIRTAVLVSDGRRTWRPQAHFDWAGLAGMRSFGFYQMGERTINYLNSRLDQLLLGKMIDATHLGYYTFGFNLSSRLSDRTNPAVMRVAFPVLSRIQGDQPRQRSVYLRMVHGLTLLNAIVHLGFATLAPSLVALFFDGKWVPAVVILQIVAATFLLRSIGNPMGSLVLSTGRASLTFWWNAVVLVVTPLTTMTGAWIGHRLGHPSTGVALSGLVTQIILFHPAYHFLVRPVLGPCLGSYLRATLVPIALAAVACAGAWYVSSFAATPVWQLASGAATGIVSYVLLCLLFDRHETIGLVRLLRSKNDPTPLLES